MWLGIKQLYPLTKFSFIYCKVNLLFGLGNEKKKQYFFLAKYLVRFICLVHTESPISYHSNQWNTVIDLLNDLFIIQLFNLHCLFYADKITIR